MSSFGLFLHNYTFNPAVDCFGKDDTALMEYFKFMALLLSKSITLPYISYKNFGFLSVQIGYILLLLLSLTGIISLSLYLKSKAIDIKSKIILILSTFSFLYVVNITIGRICLTLNASQSGRYATLIITGIFAVYLLLSLVKNKVWRVILLSFFITLLIPGYMYSFKEGHNNGSYFKNRKEGWKKCYLRYEDIDKCDYETSLPIYPNPKATELKKKLDYLKTRKLNLYKE
jgi:hypothetical protein